MMAVCWVKSNPYTYRPDVRVCCDLNQECTTEPDWTMFRPRGALSRALYDKHKFDQEQLKFDKQDWYRCSADQLTPEVKERFMQADLDSETLGFLDHCEKKSDHIFLQIWFCIAKTFLSWFMSQTNINGLLGRGSMFVLSSRQLGSLLRRSLGASGALLDLGAGDGRVTQVLAAFFSRVYVTEVATTMRWLLKKLGFTLLEVNNWQNQTYEVISCLNLLDRCEYPLTLLEQLKNSLKPDGRVIVAIVLPYNPYVESGQAIDHKPKQFLPIRGETFEEQVNSMVKDILEPAGFVVEHWTRVPYLCEGDLSRSYYWLDDAVFVLRLAS